MGTPESASPYLGRLSALLAPPNADADAAPARLIPPEDEPEPVPSPQRRSAVLLLLAGRSLEEASIVLEERGHTLRSQPGQFSLPGGGIDPGDEGAVGAALREAHEEIGLRRAEVGILGAFAEIPMPLRAQTVTPVVGWAPERPAVRRASPLEVESIHWARVVGPGSLSDPAVRRCALLDGREVGIAYDLPGGVFVWGFTAWMLEHARALLLGTGSAAAGHSLERIEVPEQRRTR